MNMTNEKKIGVLAFADKQSGGVFQYSHSLIDALSKDKEFEYVIFIDSNNDDEQFSNYDFEVRKINRSKIHIFKKIVRAVQLYLKIRKPFFFTKTEIESYKDIDLFICPIISPYPHFYLNKPFILSLHDLQEQYYPEYFTLKERIVRYLSNITLSKSSTHIICESNYVKADIVKFLNQKEDKISVIPAPPPSDFVNFKFEKDKFFEISAKYKLPCKYLFYPAQFWYHKNHIKLLEAFKVITKQYDDIYLVFTGSKKNNYKNVVQKIKELKLENRVLHLGYVDYQDLPYLYKMSEMLVMPSLFESISIPIYEAFSVKVPVCASNVVALPEQVEDAGLLFDPNDVNDIVDKITQLIDNNRLKKEITEKAYSKMLNFSHDKYKTQLINVIHICELTSREFKS